MKHTLLLTLLAVVIVSADLHAQSEVTTTAEDVEGVSLTIYNQNFAVVREKRSFSLGEGTNFVRYEDVAASIDATSLSFKSLTDPNGVAVREQNYQYDLLNPASILNKSIGKRLRYRRVLPDGTEEIFYATLLSTNSGTVVRTDDGRIVLNPSGEVTVEELPEGLVSRPSLLWKLDVNRGGTHNTEVSYLTNQINWKADYVAVVNDEETMVDLTGWVTLDNKSGATYENAQLQLLAGDVRRVQEGNRYDYNQYAAKSGAMRAAEPQFQEESFFEYHLYTLEGKTDVRDNETKQMTLLSAADVSVERKLVFDGNRRWYYGYGANRPGEGSSTQEDKVNVIVELENSKPNNMGMPLPKGKVRMYKADKRGNLQFLGEDMIDHTPRDEKLRLYVGDAFDVVGTWKRMNYDKISDRVHEADYEISIRNHKDEAAKVWVVEHLYADWTVLKKSHDFNKLDATTIEFPITVPADGEVVVKYTARYRW